ncbi:MAG: HAMP domain-containing protein [Bacteroidales bacterium]|nr:HAMP domain-containing protein [Bacteroidales bacterium]
MRKKSITKRLGLAYLFSTLTILLGAIMLYFALNNSYVLMKSMADVYSPSSELLQKLSYHVSETKMLIKNWVFVSPQDKSPDKIRLKQLHDSDIPELLSELELLSEGWEPEEKEVLQHLIFHFNEYLLPAQREVMEILNTFEDYNNAMLVFTAQSLVEEETDPVMIVTTSLIREINDFVAQLTRKSEVVKAEARKSMNAYKLLIIFIAVSIVLGTLLLASFINRTVIKPLKELDKAASLVQSGYLDIQLEIKQDDEIGSLSENFNKMILSLKDQQNDLEEFNQLLLKSQKKLKETNKTKDKFFNIIAHDLKGPFTSFLAITDILNNDPDSFNEDQKRHFLKSLNNSALYLESLLENLLQWARTQSGTLEVNLRCVKVVDMVIQNLKIISINAQKNNIQLINEIEEDVFALADPNLLNTIFRNLISNAVKFSKQDGQVRISSSIKSEKMIEFSIHDQGIGIAEEDLQKLFRIDVNTKFIGESTEKGTGFGLILCKDFVEKQGGQISVESQLDKGSSFRFTLAICK